MRIQGHTFQSCPGFDTYWVHCSTAAIVERTFLIILHFVLAFCLWHPSLRWLKPSWGRPHAGSLTRKRTLHTVLLASAAPREGALDAPGEIWVRGAETNSLRPQAVTPSQAPVYPGRRGRLGEIKSAQLEPCTHHRMQEDSVFCWCTRISLWSLCIFFHGY